MADSPHIPPHGRRFPGESEAYRSARNSLLAQEIGLRRQIETVAAARRALPTGGEPPEDYRFERASGGKVRLSELFGDCPSLIVYSFMFGPEMERPCPSCSSIIDALDGEWKHVSQRAALVAVAKSPPERIAAMQAERSWSHIPFLSSADNSYNRDYFAEDERGSQWPILNVFNRTAEGIRHSYATELLFVPPDPGQQSRHVDSIWPLWNLLDFTPDGRGEFHPKLGYS